MIICIYIYIYTYYHFFIQISYVYIKKNIYIHAEILQPLLLRVNMHALSFTLSPTKLSPFAAVFNILKLYLIIKSANKT